MTTTTRPWVTVSTALIAALVLTTSALGLFTDWPYAAETAEWRLQARAQDVGNLAAVAVLLAGAARAVRGSLRGLLEWAGALLYLGYAFFIYAMTLHFSGLFLAYVAVIGLSVHALVLWLPWRDGAVIAPRPRRFGAGLASVIAVLFALLWLTSIGTALARGEAPAELAATGLVANPVHVLDLALVLPGMLVTARLAVRDSRPAQLLLGPWLVFSALMAATIGLTLVLGGGWGPAAVVGLLAVVAAVVSIRLGAAISPGRAE